MPELPEVETVVRTLRPQVLNARIMGVELLRPSIVLPESLPLDSLCGCRISAVDRRGKLVLLRMLAEGKQGGAGRKPDYLVVHLRMTGRLMPHPADTPPHAHTRCLFHLEGPQGASVLFFDDVRAFGVLFAATETLLEGWTFWRELGPEPLAVPPDALARQLAPRFAGRRGAVKSLLLDQSVLAGIGNIYADEALFRAGIDPRRAANTLDAPALLRLCRALQEVLRLSIAQCGSSIRDYRDANGNVGAFQNSFAVYGRGDEPCQNCGRPLEKARIAGRATVFCPHCQQ